MYQIIACLDCNQDLRPDYLYKSVNDKGGNFIQLDMISITSRKSEQVLQTFCTFGAPVASTESLQ